jgi:MFS family permease
VLGYHPTLLIDTATFGLLVVTGAVVRTRRGRRYDARTATGDDHTESDPDARMTGRQYIFNDSLMKLLVPALWLFILAIEATNVVEIFLVTDDLGASAAIYGVTMAAMMLGQIVGPVVAGQVSTDVRRVVWTGVSAGALGVLVTGIGLSPSVWLVIPLFAVCGVAAGALNTLISTMIVMRSPEHMRGRVLSTLTGTARGCSVLAMVLGGLSGQLLGARTTFVVCGLLSVLVAALVVRSKSGLAERSPWESDNTPEAGRVAAESRALALPTS